MSMSGGLDDKKKLEVINETAKVFNENKEILKNKGYEYLATFAERVTALDESGHRKQLNLKGTISNIIVFQFTNKENSKIMSNIANGTYKSLRAVKSPGETKAIVRSL